MHSISDPAGMVDTNPSRIVPVAAGSSSMARISSHNICRRAEQQSGIGRVSGFHITVIQAFSIPSWHPIEPKRLVKFLYFRTVYGVRDLAQQLRQLAKWSGHVSGATERETGQ
jgi:hypothetical protein